MSKIKKEIIGIDFEGYDEASISSIENILTKMSMKPERMRSIPVCAGGLADFLAIGFTFLTLSGLSIFLKELLKESGKILAQKILTTPKEKERHEGLISDFREKYPDRSDLYEQPITIYRLIIIKIDSLNIARDIHIRNPKNSDQLHQAIYKEIEKIIELKVGRGEGKTAKSIQVQFVHPTEGRIITVSLDDDLTAEETISELIRHDFISNDLGHYSIAIKGGLLLKNDISLFQNGVNDGDTLRIIPGTDAG
jgi:hypothetical protein